MGNVILGAKYQLYRHKCQVQIEAIKRVCHTVQVEMTPVENGSAMYDNKIMMELSQIELPDFCATMFGIKRRFEDHHNQRERRLLLMWIDKDEGEILQITMTQNEITLKTILNPNDIAYLSGIAIGQFARQINASDSAAIACIRQSYRGR